MNDLQGEKHVYRSTNVEILMHFLSTNNYSERSEAIFPSTVSVVVVVGNGRPRVQTCSSCSALTQYRYSTSTLASIPAHTIVREVGLVSTACACANHLLVSGGYGLSLVKQWRHNERMWIEVDRSSIEGFWPYLIAC